MNKDFQEKNLESNSSNDLYSDYPKDIVKIMMENHPFRKNEQNAEVEDTETDDNFEEKITESKEDDVYSPAENRRIDKHKKGASDLNDNISSFDFDPNSLFNESNMKESKNKSDSSNVFTKDKLHSNEIKPELKKTQGIKNTSSIDESDSFEDDIEDIIDVSQRKRSANKAGADEVDEQVQVVRHKEGKKKFKRDFGISEQNTFEDIKNKITEEKRERRERMEKGGSKTIHDSHKKDTYNEAQYKKKRNRSRDSLDLLKTPSESKKLNQQSEITPVGKKVIIAAGVVVLLFLFLFIRNITLTHKVNVLSSQLADYQNMQKKNEDYKLAILSLQDKLKTGATSSEEGTGTKNGKQENKTENSTSKVDTYTVVTGDTLSGISQKVYGNYSGYKKILEANGLTENSNIKIGQTLKIPK